PSKRQSIWASVSRAVRTPDELEDALALNFNLGGGRSFTLLPNRDFGAEEVIAYELGYRQQVTDRLSFDTALFYNRYRSLAVFASTNNLLNGMDGEGYGVEVAATWRRTDWWKLSAAYSYLRLCLHTDPNLSAGTRAVGESAEKTTPQNNFYLRSSFDLSHNV